MGKKVTVKIFAFLALFGIIVGILGTGFLFFMTTTSNQTDDNYTKSLTQEELQKIIEQSSSGASIDNQIEELTQTGSGVDIDKSLDQ